MRCNGWIVGAALALLLVIGFGSAAYGRGVSEKYAEKVLAVQLATEADDYARALALTDALALDWARESPLLQGFVNHSDTDEVTVGIARLKVTLREQNRLQALLALTDLDENFGHLYHRDEAALKNIF